MLVGECGVSPQSAGDIAGVTILGEKGHGGAFGAWFCPTGPRGYCEVGSTGFGRSDTANWSFIRANIEINFYELLGQFHNSFFEKGRRITVNRKNVSFRRPSSNKTSSTRANWSN